MPAVVYVLLWISVRALVIVSTLHYTNTVRNVSRIVNEHAKIVNFLTHNTHFSAVSDKNDGIAKNFTKLLEVCARESKSECVLGRLF